MADDDPPGISLEQFKSISLEVGDWLWGTVQGGFNEKATSSQMVVDAAIGMIPLVGDVTGVRDLLAVLIGLCTEPKKRESWFQWVLLVVFALSLIPVLGGIIKGVGRLAVKSAAETAKLASEGARAAAMARNVEEAVAWLNRVGVGNAERWLLQLKFAAYQSEVAQKLLSFIETLSKTLASIREHFGAVLPGMAQTIDGVLAGMRKVKEMVPTRVADAIRRLDEHLSEMQRYVHSGGESTSRLATERAATEAKNLSRVDEAIMLEGRGATITKRGGLKANPKEPGLIDEVYQFEEGFPDIRFPDKKGNFPNVATYSGKIVNRYLEEGEEIFRVFGPETPFPFGGGVIDESFPAGRFPDSPGFWGIGSPPADAKSWRELCAVLDAWNANTLIVVGRLLPGKRVAAATGVIAEQVGTKFGPQFLPGGAKQAMLIVGKAVSEELTKLAAIAKSTGEPAQLVLEGVAWEVRKTNWTDVLGVFGYPQMPGPGAVQTARLAAKEIAEKMESQ